MWKMIVFSTTETQNHGVEESDIFGRINDSLAGAYFSLKKHIRYRRYQILCPQG